MLIQDSTFTTHRTGIQRLPLELFSDNILLSCLPDDTFQKPQKDQAPLSVSQVCQSWRAAAFATPRLWSSMHVNCSGRRKLDVATVILPMTELWLSRSLNYPLAISLDIGLWNGQAEFLSRYLFRTQQLRIMILGESRLEDATIFQPSHCLMNIPLGQLTIGDAILILSHCAEIRYLNISILESHLCPKQQVILPHLSTFVLTSTNPKNLFQVLSLPKLSVFRCTAPSRKTTWPQRSFKEFYRRSKFSLTILNLYWYSMRELDLSVILTDICTNITELSIKGPPSCISDFLLDNLRINPPSPIICPKLKVLSLHSCVALDCSDGALAAMVRSRLAESVNAPLREAGLVGLQTVKVSDDLWRGELEELLAMRQDALIVEVYDAKSTHRLLDI